MRWLAWRHALLVALGVGGVAFGLGCVGPHSNGAVWAVQNLDAERAMFQLGDTRRAQLARDFQLGLADDTLGSEQQRVQADLEACPGPERSAFAPSRRDTLRDSVRIRAESDAQRLQSLANVALADWYIRSASATGDASFCDRARAALNGSAAPPQQQALLARVPTTTVARDPSAEPVQAEAGSLSNYALGYLDAVTGAAPLPQYLALTYGGALLNAQPTMDAQTAAGMVDAQAAAYPQWEPDALYAAVRGGDWP